MKAFAASSTIEASPTAIWEILVEDLPIPLACVGRELLEILEVALS